MTSMIDRDLEILHQELLLMGALCEEAIGNMAKSFVEYNFNWATKAGDTELEIKKKGRDIEDLCLKFLLRQQPVAKDLRKISSILKIITDMDRIGRQTRDIADIVLNVDLALPNNNEYIKTIARETMKMVTDSIEAYISSDLQACKLVRQHDSIIDDLFDRIKDDIIQMVSENKMKIESGMYLLMVAKYFEKIADHATNIARWVEFSITGVHKGRGLS